MSRKAWLLFAVLGLVWGLPYLLIRIAVQELDPLMVAFARTSIGAAILLPLALRGGALVQAFRRWKALLAFAVVEIVGPWLLLGHAETRLTSSTAGLLIAVVPLTTAVLLSLLGDERLGGRRLAGLALGFAGVAVLVGLDLRLDDGPAVAAMLLAALGYAVGAIVMSKGLADAPPLGVVAGSMLLATLIYAPGAPFVWPDQVSSDVLWAVLILAVVCTALAFWLFVQLIAEAGAARATVVTYVNPAVAITLGAVVLHEPVTTGLMFGFPLIILGSILSTSRRTPAGAEAT